MKVFYSHYERNFMDVGAHGLCDAAQWSTKTKIEEHIDRFNLYKLFQYDPYRLRIWSHTIRQ